MRLIDADIFKTEYDNLITWVSHRAEKARLIEFVNDIQSQPTIKAIPIEWIWKWDIDNYPFTALLMSEIIPKMIEDWEKENETDTN